MPKTLSRLQEPGRDMLNARRDNMYHLPAVNSLAALTLGWDARFVGGSVLLKADCFDWLKRAPENSLHAIVTDPPYGVKEYDADQLQKREEGRGGVWRIPPAFDGHQRSPLPRFTALDKKERQRILEFFTEWARLAGAALPPGGHLFIATNSFMSQLVYGALVEGKLEFRGEIIRLVQTLRGGDRPKNEEKEFPDVCSMPRGCFEPWGLFRKPLPIRMTVGECLRQFQTGGAQIAGRQYVQGCYSKRKDATARAQNRGPSQLETAVFFAANGLCGTAAGRGGGGGSFYGIRINRGCRGTSRIAFHRSGARRQLLCHVREGGAKACRAGAGPG